MAYVSLEYIKDHVRPDETERDEYLLGLTNAAEQYLAAAGVLPEAVATPNYQLTVGSMVLFWYDHRSDPTVTTHGGFDAATRWLINNLKQEAQLHGLSNLDTIC